jgi:putative transposase
VITQAKRTTERGWLAEVPSVALVQSVNDSRRAWRNFFDSHRGKRPGRPRMKSKKDNRQSSGSPATDFVCVQLAGCL